MNLTEDCYVATPEKLAAAVDENTIGVALVLGTTYTGAFEDVKAVDALLGNPRFLPLLSWAHASPPSYSYGLNSGPQVC